MQSVSKRKNKSLLLKMPNLVLDSLQQNFFQLPLECFEQPQAQSKHLRAKNYSRSGPSQAQASREQPTCRVWLGRGKGAGVEVSGQILISASFDLKI